MLSLESRRLCQTSHLLFHQPAHWVMLLGRFVCPHRCPSAGSDSPGPGEAGSAQALPGLWGNPSTALLGTILEKEGAQACRGENLEQAWNRDLERLQLPPGWLCPFLPETRFGCCRVGHGAACIFQGGCTNRLQICALSAPFAIF